MTIASLTAAPAAPAPKGAASPVQTATVPPDAQTAAVATEAPVLSNLQIAVAAARQSAAARQDGLAVLMANLLRAAASGNLPTPVQQAVDQLIALHLPTDVAPDAAAVKTALLTSGLFTEANLAAGPGAVPADIKTTLLQLNTATASWLARGPSNAAPQPATPSPTAVPVQSPATQAAQPVPAAQSAIRAGQTVPLAVPPSPNPLRRAAPRTNEVSNNKPSAPSQRSTPGKNPAPAEASAQTDTAPEAETIRSAIRLLGEITQALKTHGAAELPKEIKAALVLATKAAAPSLPEELQTPQPAIASQPATLPSLPKAAEQLPASSSSTLTTGATKPAPTPVTPSAAPPQMPSPPAAPGFAPRGSSPVEQLLALQLAPAPMSSSLSVAENLPVLLSAPAAASPTPASVSALPTLAVDAGVVRAPLAPPPLTPGQPDTAPAKPNGPAALLLPQPVSPEVQPSAVPSSASFTPQAGLPNNTKTLLTLFAGALKVLLPSASSAATTQPDAPLQQQPAVPAPTVQPPSDITAAISTLSNAGLLSLASGNVPNDLKTLLSLFNMAAEAWLPRAAPAAEATNAAGTPSVPPPVRGAPSKAQPTAPATLPEGADPVATAKQLLSGSDAALARHTLLQIASLPDAAPQSRDARWVFDVPLMTPQGTAVAQMIIERDGSGVSAEKPMPVWRVQFAIDIEPLGPVRANLALSGDRAWVTISADRPESLDKLQSGVSWLANALQSTELDADIAFQPGQAPQRGGNASRFMDHAS